MFKKAKSENFSKDMERSPLLTLLKILSRVNAEDLLSLTIKPTIKLQMLAKSLINTNFIIERWKLKLQKEELGTKKLLESTKDTTDQSIIKEEDLHHHMAEEKGIDQEVEEEETPETEDTPEDITENVAIQEIVDQETGAREDTEEETIVQDLEIVIDLIPETEESEFKKIHKTKSSIY